MYSRREIAWFLYVPVGASKVHVCCAMGDSYVLPTLGHRGPARLTTEGQGFAQRFRLSPLLVVRRGPAGPPIPGCALDHGPLAGVVFFRCIAVVLAATADPEDFSAHELGQTVLGLFGREVEQFVLVPQEHRAAQQLLLGEI